MQPIPRRLDADGGQRVGGQAVGKGMPRLGNSFATCFAIPSCSLPFFAVLSAAPFSIFAARTSFVSTHCFAFVFNICFALLMWSFQSSMVEQRKFQGY